MFSCHVHCPFVCLFSLALLIWKAIRKHGVGNASRQDVDIVLYSIHINIYCIVWCRRILCIDGNL